MEATMTKTNDKATKKDRIQAVLERQKSHLLNDKLFALMVTFVMTVGIAGLS
jgi:hypothetical protein